MPMSDFPTMPYALPYAPDFSNDIHPYSTANNYNHVDDAPQLIDKHLLEFPPPMNTSQNASMTSPVLYPPPGLGYGGPYGPAPFHASTMDSFANMSQAAIEPYVLNNDDKAARPIKNLPASMPTVRASVPFYGAPGVGCTPALLYAPAAGSDVNIGMDQDWSASTLSAHHAFDTATAASASVAASQNDVNIGSPLGWTAPGDDFAVPSEQPFAGEVDVHGNGPAVSPEDLVQGYMEQMLALQDAAQANGLSSSVDVDAGQQFHFHGEGTAAPAQLPLLPLPSFEEDHWLSVSDAAHMDSSVPVLPFTSPDMPPIDPSDPLCQMFNADAGGPSANPEGVDMQDFMAQLRPASQPVDFSQVQNAAAHFSAYDNVPTHALPPNQDQGSYTPPLMAAHPGPFNDGSNGFSGDFAGNAMGTETMHTSCTQVARPPFSLVPHMDFGGPTAFHGSQAMPSEDGIGGGHGHYRHDGAGHAHHGHKHALRRSQRIHDDSHYAHDPEYQYAPGPSEQMHTFDDAAYDDHIVQGYRQDGYLSHQRGMSATGFSSASSPPTTPDMTPDSTPSPRPEEAALAAPRPRGKKRKAGAARARAAVKPKVEKLFTKAAGILHGECPTPPDDNPVLSEAELAVRTVVEYAGREFIKVQGPGEKIKCGWLDPVVDADGTRRTQECTKSFLADDLPTHIRKAHSSIRLTVGGKAKMYCNWGEGDFFCGALLSATSLVTHVRDKHIHDTNVLCTWCGQGMTRSPEEGSVKYGPRHKHAGLAGCGPWRMVREAPSSRNMKAQVGENFDALTFFMEQAHLELRPPPVPKAASAGRAAGATRSRRSQRGR